MSDQTEHSESRHGFPDLRHRWRPAFYAGLATAIVVVSAWIMLGGYGHGDGFIYLVIASLFPYVVVWATFGRGFPSDNSPPVPHSLIAACSALDAAVVLGGLSVGAARAGQSFWAGLEGAHRELRFFESLAGAESMVTTLIVIVLPAILVPWISELKNAGRTRGPRD